MEHLPFISTHLWNPERIGAIAIYCSDGRWGEAFDEVLPRRPAHPALRPLRRSRRATLARNAVPDRLGKVHDIS